MARILLVDDDLFVIESLAATLERSGNIVVQARNGVEALQVFKPGEFDLIITDIIMPGEEGLGLIQKMRILDREARIIAISGGGRTGNVEFLRMATDLGAVATISKPIRLAHLIEVVNQCLALSPIHAGTP